MADTMNFTIKASKANPKIVAVRVLDASTGEWFEANGTDAAHLVWNKTPTVNIGANFTIAALARTATAGRVRLTINCSANTSIYTRQVLDLGAGGQIEASGDWTMPGSDVTVTIEATETL